MAYSILQPAYFKQQLRNPAKTLNSEFAMDLYRLFAPHANPLVTAGQVPWPCKRSSKRNPLTRHQVQNRICVSGPGVPRHPTLPRTPLGDLTEYWSPRRNVNSRLYRQVTPAGTLALFIAETIYHQQHPHPTKR
jgi:hypothetical protein